MKRRTSSRRLLALALFSTLLVTVGCDGPPSLSELPLGDKLPMMDEIDGLKDTLDDALSLKMVDVGSDHGGHLDHAGEAVGDARAGAAEGLEIEDSA